jgi:hypothetical protein
MTVGEMMRRMTAREYDDWRRFATHQPFGDRRGDTQAAMVASAIVNVNRAKGATAIPISDFLPDFDPPPTPEEQAAKAEEAERIAAWQAKARAHRKQA